MHAYAYANTIYINVYHVRLAIEISIVGSNIEILRRNLYTLPNIIKTIKSRRIRWVGQVARVREIRNADKILVRKPELKRPLGRRRYR
jgi:hypothetical protein